MDIRRLAVGILEDVAITPMQDARLAVGQRGSMASWLGTAPPCLDTNEFHAGVADERVEHASGITAAAHASHNHIGQAPEPLEGLLPRFPADHRLEIAHDHRKGMRADDAADDVVGVFHGRHPVAQRFIDGVAQGPAAALYRHDLSSQGPHLEDV